MVPRMVLIRPGLLFCQVYASLLDRLKVNGSVLAQGAYKVIRQHISLVDVSAHLADKAFLALGLAAASMLP